MTSLDQILVVFIGLSVISIVGIIFLFLLKNEKQKTIVFYLLSVLGMVISYMNATSIPRDFVGEQVIAWGLGFLSVIAVLLKITGKTEKRFNVAKVLTVVSVLGGIAHLFLL